ncbi:TonB-dependent receptor plug domain-containing protein [Bowmanella denitrificans]|uniref:TonB-dependent receptor plug domain-containing protein n=1 Tax=Bowmanella denitrificans TaxID=366582 RepID=UPI001558DA9E|nr:TonB-dependent receptor [Bowmanella denitrificans]
MKFSVLFLCAATSLKLAAQTEQLSVFDLSFEQLLNMDVVAPGKFSQPLDSAPGVTTVISREEIQSLGATSLLEVLEQAPGVLMMGSFFYPQNLAVIRGLQLTHSNNEVLLLINGRPVRDSFTGGQNFAIYTAFPIQSLDRIEIVRGPGSVLYGSNAFSGVINLVTRSQDNAESVYVATGNLGSREMQIQGSMESGEGYINGAARFYQDDGWQFKAKDNSGLDGSFAAEQQNHALMLQGQWQGWRASAVNLVSEQAFWGSVSSWSGPPQEDRTVRSRRSILELGRSWDLASQLRLDTDISYNASRFSHYNYRANSDNILFEALLDYDLLDQGRWLFGGTAWHQRVNTEPGLAKAPIPAFSRTWYSLYGQYQTTNSNALNWSLGAQYNKVPDVNANYELRAGLIYTLSAKSGIKLDYGGAFRAAYGVETHFNLIVCCDAEGNNTGGLRGNQQLEPEQITTFNLQYFHTGEDSRHTLTLFHSDLSNLVSRLRAADRVLDFVNAGDLEAYGTELEGKWLFEQGQINYSYSYQHNESEDLENYTLMPNHMLKWSLIYAIGQDWWLGLQHSWVSAFHANQIRNPNTQSYNPEPSSYHLLRLKLARKLTWLQQSTELALSVSNMLDEDIYQPEIAGRNINSHPMRSGVRVNMGLNIGW